MCSDDEPINYKTHVSDAGAAMHRRSSGFNPGPSVSTYTRDIPSVSTTLHRDIPSVSTTLHSERCITISSNAAYNS